MQARLRPEASRTNRARLARLRQELPGSPAGQLILSSHCNHGDSPVQVLLAVSMHDQLYGSARPTGR